MTVGLRNDDIISAIWVATGWKLIQVHSIKNHAWFGTFSCWARVSYTFQSSKVCMKADYRIPINKLLIQIASWLLLGRDKPACPGQVKITGGQANVKLTSLPNRASGYPARLGNHGWESNLPFWWSETWKKTVFESIIIKTPITSVFSQSFRFY